jgi:Flp pilus assembly protein TadD
LLFRFEKDTQEAGVGAEAGSIAYLPALQAFQASMAFGANLFTEEAHLGMATVLAQVGKHDMAKDVMYEAFDIAPRDALTCSMLSQTLLANKMYEDAMIYGLAATLNQPRSGVAHNRYGVAAAEAQKHEIAMQAYVAALRLNNRDPEVLCNAGLSAAVVGKQEDAEKFFMAALDVDPDHKRTERELAKLRGRMMMQ